MYGLKIFLLGLFLFSILGDFDQGEKLFHQGKYEEAKICFQKCYNKNPNHLKTIEYLGDIASHQKKWDDAIIKYNLLKEKNPKVAMYWYKYGGAMGMKAKSVNRFKAFTMIDDIENAFLTAAKLDAEHIDTRWALVIFYIELPGIVGGSESKAQQYANELMTLSSVDGYLAKGYIDEYFKRYKKAELNYRKAHEIGQSKTTFQKLYNLYLNKIKDKAKATKLKEQFEK